MKYKKIIEFFEKYKEDTINKKTISELYSKQYNSNNSRTIDNVITYLLNIIVIYATYYLKEPVHLPGTAFPGSVSIYCDGRDYFCPIKKYHMNSVKSVCKYCIANTIKE